MRGVYYTVRLLFLILFFSKTSGNVFYTSETSPEKTIRFKLEVIDVSNSPGLFCPIDDNANQYPEIIPVRLVNVEAFDVPIPVEVTTSTTSTASTSTTTTTTILIETTANITTSSTTTTTTTTEFVTEPNASPLPVGKPPLPPTCRFSGAAGGALGVVGILSLIILFYFVKNRHREETVYSILLVSSLIVCVTLTGYRHCLTEHSKVIERLSHGNVLLRVRDISGLDISSSAALRTDVPLTGLKTNNLYEIRFSDTPYRKSTPYDGSALARQGMDHTHVTTKKKHHHAVPLIKSHSQAMHETHCQHLSKNAPLTGLAPFFESSLTSFTRGCDKDEFTGFFCATNDTFIIRICPILDSNNNVRE